MSDGGSFVWWVVEFWLSGGWVGCWWVGGWTKTKLMQNSTQVEVVLEVGVELGNYNKE